MIRLLNSGDAGAYHSLLVQSFGSAEGFTVNSVGTVWGNTENYYPTFGVFHDGVLVSMLRTEWVLTLRELEYKILAPYQNPELKFPAMYLAKAATLPSAKSQGLNSVLRYLSLQMAMHWKVRFVFGVMVEGSPRIFTMQEMGYEFQKQKKKWNGSFVSEKAPLLATLDMQKMGAHALAYLAPSVEKYLAMCDLQVNVGEVLINERPGARWPWTA